MCEFACEIDMKHRKKIFKIFALVSLFCVFVFNLLIQLRVEPVLYFGAEISNPFQAEGDFYDPVKGHTGIDLGMPEGSALSLPVPIRVVDVREQYEMGTTLYAKDAWGNILVFSHLSEVLFEVGDLVKGGETFALSGNTGKATTGPHLHFEILAPEAQAGYEEMTRTLGNYSGWNVDPEGYLEVLL